MSLNTCSTSILWRWGFAMTMSLFTGCHSEANDRRNSDPLWLIQRQASSVFLTSTLALQKSVVALCKDINQNSLKNAQDDWIQAMHDWQPFVGGNAGNEQAMSVSWSLQFYPDKKNTTGRQLNQLIKSKESVSTETLSGKSVAVQGLGAMEWLLFDQASVGAMPSRCPLAQAVAARVYQSAQEMHRAWKNNPWQGVDSKQHEAAILAGMATQLDAIAKTLSLPMGKPGFPKPYQAQAWRSGQSLSLLKTGLVALLQRNQKTLQPLLAQKGHQLLSDRVTKHLLQAIESVPDSKAIAPLLEEKAEYQTLMVTANHLHYLQVALSDEVGPSLGVVVGFNATDGD
ncbi:iron-regulated protein A precursor [Grimontia hollisae]|nr:imelysin family protein [Grimontia hollisae]AMG31731.1 iron-regulated protein A precursor [Grimontia hollisae]STO44917.1 Predicted periplasmic lipoprotein [Grimontia hollisae]